MSVNSIDSDQYVDGSIDTAHIADNQITLAKMAGGTDGNIISYDASGDPVAIATGSDGQVLTSAGAGQPPAFESPAAGVGGSSGVDFNDNVAARWGTGNDLSISTNGTNSYINNTGSGDLLIRGNDVKIQGTTGSESMAHFVEDGAVELYHNNRIRISTTEDGVKIGSDTEKTFQGYESIQLADRCMIGGYANDSLGIFYNTYHSSGSKAIDTAAAANIQLINSGIRFQTAASVSADAAQTMVDRLTILTAGQGRSSFTAGMWCFFNGTGTIAINDSHNVSSLQDNSAGNYHVLIDVNLSTISCSTATNFPQSTDDEIAHCENQGNADAVHVKVRRSSNGNEVDCNKVQVVTFDNV
jgi:hypothetical protein